MSISKAEEYANCKAARSTSGFESKQLVTLGGKQALRLAQAVTKETVLKAEKRVDMVLKLEARVDME